MATGNFGPVAKKSLGQHWLKDELVLDYIANTADIKPSDVILEIGPGTGNLTRLLLKEAKQVIAVELDQELVSYLSNQKLPKLEVVYQDILTFNFNELEPGYKIVANIPYYLTGKLIRLISEIANRPSLVILLVQKEIAERMAAKPGDLSILGLTSQYFFEVEKGMLVTSDKFDPPPKVDSQVIILKPKEKLALNIDDQIKLFKLIRIGFAARRKTILNNLSAGFSLNKDELQAKLATLNIDPKRRPQTLSLEEWISLIGI